MAINDNFPKVIFGTSALGNLYSALDDSVKCEIVSECISHSSRPVVFDSAGKYGAGLALESLGSCLNQLGVKPEDVVISNKLGWYRTELKTPEPTFEPGVWRDLKFDAVQKISYEGIMECFEQGNELLQGYIPKLLSIHDPDEYMANATSREEEQELYANILEGYRALNDLKKKHGITIGVGAKSWKIIERIYQDVQFDWVMIANSMTIKSHPKELLDFMEKLEADGVEIINSAVFHGGFLMGGDYYDYRLVTPDNEKDLALIKWREEFSSLCEKHHISAAAACVQFGLSAPGVKSIALSTTNPRRVKQNIELGNTPIPPAFWQEMKEKNLIQDFYRYI